MEPIDKAVVAQKWLMEHYRQWIPLDACLALVNSINDAAQQTVAADGAVAPIKCSECGDEILPICEACAGDMRRS